VWGKRADTLDGSKKQVNNNVDRYFAEILNKISVEHYLGFCSLIVFSIV